MRLLHRVFGLIVLAVAALAGLGPVSAQESQSRFAFVVGNDGYDGAPLATAANDAALVADALKAARFDVTGARNLDQDTLRASYREFLAKVTAAGPGAVSLVYLSGYGLQFDGENYLVPPGAAIARDADVSLNAIRLADLIRPLSGAPGRGRAVLLDLAYASPFDKQIQGLPPGLAIVEPEAGTIIAFNAAPGAWAAPGKEPYGAYAQALSEMLREPGLPIEEILVRVRTRAAELTRAAQVPWSAGKIEPALVLLERGADAPAPAVTPDQLSAERAKPVDTMPEALAYSAVIDRDTVKGYEDFVATYPQSPYAKNVRGLLAARREARTWRRTLDVNSQNAYWSYLKRYPRGPHAAEARRRLTRLQAALEPPPAFDPVVYDDPPPPPVEEAYFAGPDVDYYDPGVPPLVPSVFVAAPPPWYQPPPPPAFDEDSDFFLPEVIAVVTAPAWIAPPPYVAPPPVPFMMEAAARPPGWRPFVAIPAALAVGLAAGKLSNRFLDNRRQNLGQQGRPPRQPFIPSISSQAKGVNLPTGVRPGQTFVRPTAPVGLQPGRPGVGQPGLGQPGPGAGHPAQPVGIGRPGNALPGLPGGQPGVRPGVVGQPGGTPGVGTPMTQPGGRPGNALPGVQGGPPGGRPGVVGQPGGTPGVGTPMTQPGGRPGNALPGVQGGPPGGRPGVVGQPGGTPGVGTPVTQPGGRPGNALPGGQPGVRPGVVGQPGGAPLTQPGGRPGQPAGVQQQQIQQQRQQQMQQQQQQRQQQLQQQQQQQRQQQMQQQRVQQQQMQQQRQQQQMQQQRMQQQQMQQQRMQQQRQQQQMQQQRMQQQQRQQQMMQQQRMQQQQRQQQMMMQQRQQQIMQQQRQQQIMQQQRQQQMQRRCPPGMRC